MSLPYSTRKIDGKESDGTSLHMTGQTADVVRRQSDGSCLFVIDSPLGGGWKNRNSGLYDPFLIWFDRYFFDPIVMNEGYGLPTRSAEGIRVERQTVGSLPTVVQKSTAAIIAAPRS